MRPSRLGLGVAVGLVLGCRPPADHARPASGPITEPQPSGEGDEASVEPPPPEPAPGPDTGGSASLEGTACERRCADVHACVLVAGETPSAAATIELGCLDACVRAPDGIAGCLAPEPIDGPRCVAFLECTRSAWPDAGGSAIVVEPPPDYCAIVCTAFGACSDLAADSLEVSACAVKCRDTLDPALQPSAAECAKLDGCEAIEACVTSIPGA